MCFELTKVYSNIHIYLNSSIQYFIAQMTCSQPNGIRLVKTPSLTVETAGRLEICINGVWGSIRTPTLFWPIKNVQVACLELDFNGGLNSVPSTQYVQFTCRYNIMK